MQLVSFMVLLIGGMVLYSFTTGADTLNESASKTELSQTKTELQVEIKEVKSESIKGDDELKELIKDKVGKDEFAAFKGQLKTISDYIMDNK